MEERRKTEKLAHTSSSQCLLASLHAMQSSTPEVRRTAKGVHYLKQEAACAAERMSRSLKMRDFEVANCSLQLLRSSTLTIDQTQPATPTRLNNRWSPNCCCRSVTLNALCNRMRWVQKLGKNSGHQQCLRQRSCGPKK